MRGLLPPDKVSISIDQPSQLACTGWGGAQSCEGSKASQAFVFKNEVVYLYLSFDPSIIGNYSEEGFRNKFKYLNATVALPDIATSGYRYETSERIRTGDPRLVSLAYDTGRPLGQVDLGSITYISRRIESREDTCMSGDILGMCACTYEIPPTPVDIKFSLAVPQSGAVSDEK